VGPTRVSQKNGILDTKAFQVCRPTSAYQSFPFTDDDPKVIRVGISPPISRQQLSIFLRMPKANVKQKIRAECANVRTDPINRKGQ
jgi:hypothetical protein